jgi:hypothetical protein
MFPLEPSESSWGASSKTNFSIAFLLLEGILARSVKNLFLYFTFNQLSPVFGSKLVPRQAREILH